MERVEDLSGKKKSSWSLEHSCRAYNCTSPERLKKLSALINCCKYAALQHAIRLSSRTRLTADGPNLLSTGQIEISTGKQPLIRET